MPPRIGKPVETNAAHYRVYQDQEAALALLQPFEDHLRDAGLGSISEILEGNPPHLPRGCIAQAWGVAEVLRVWRGSHESRPFMHLLPTLWFRNTWSWDVTVARPELRATTRGATLCHHVRDVCPGPPRHGPSYAGGVALAVGVGVAVWVAVGVPVSVAVGDAVAVFVGVAVPVFVGDAVAVFVGVAVGVPVEVGVCVGVLVGVTVPVDVAGGVPVGVVVGVVVGVLVDVAVAV